MKSLSESQCASRKEIITARSLRVSLCPSSGPGRQPRVSKHDQDIKSTAIKRAGHSSVSLRSIIKVSLAFSSTHLLACHEFAARLLIYLSCQDVSSFN